MDDCDKVNLLKVQGQYLRFIVENNAELDILEHIERCEECRSEILGGSEERPAPNQTMATYSSGNSMTRRYPSTEITRNQMNFIDARIQWRKKNTQRTRKERRDGAQ